MPRLARCSLVVMVLSGGLSSAAFAETTIKCPLPQATRTITDPMPEGWWTTPVVKRLSNTRVKRIGGRLALMCLYGRAGSIQRRPPKEQTCTARRGGFLCVSRPRPPAPRRERGVASAGTITVRQNYMVDLDRGNEQRKGADFWFEAVTRDRLYLTPRNKARIGVGNRRKRGFEGCSRARFSKYRVPLHDLPVGSYVCVKTDEGRIGQFRVLALSSSTPETFRIRFTTWQLD